MKQASLNMKNFVNDLEVLANEYQNSGSKFQISAKDRQKRVEKILKLKQQSTETQAQYDVYLASKGMAMQADEEAPLVRNKGEDGEYDHTRDLTS